MGFPTREHLESSQNWVATFEYTLFPGTFRCLMETLTQDGYYWAEVSKTARFPFYTQPTSMYMGDDLLREEIERGYMTLVSGDLPSEMEESVESKKNPLSDKELAESVEAIMAVDLLE